MGAPVAGPYRGDWSDDYVKFSSEPSVPATRRNDNLNALRPRTIQSALRTLPTGFIEPCLPTSSKRPPHSITSSALAIRVSGTVTPSALAVFRFTTSSNLTARSMGKFTGGVPFKILSTKAAER